MPEKEILSALLEKASEINVDAAQNSAAAEVSRANDNNADKVDLVADGHSHHNHG